MAALYLSSRYRYGSPYRRPYSNRYDRVTRDTEISDIWLKKASNDSSLSVYDCVHLNGTIGVTCYESVKNITKPTSQNDKDFSVEDGGCCEKNKIPICCLIKLNEAQALKYFVIISYYFIHLRSLVFNKLFNNNFLIN